MKKREQWEEMRDDGGMKSRHLPVRLHKFAEINMRPKIITRVSDLLKTGSIKGPSPSLFSRWNPVVSQLCWQIDFIFFCFVSMKTCRELIRHISDSGHYPLNPHADGKSGEVSPSTGPINNSLEDNAVFIIDFCTENSSLSVSVAIAATAPQSIFSLHICCFLFAADSACCHS